MRVWHEVVNAILPNQIGRTKTQKHHHEDGHTQQISHREDLRGSSLRPFYHRFISCLASLFLDTIGKLKTIWSDADEELRGRLVDAARGAAVPGGAIIVLPFSTEVSQKSYAPSHNPIKQ